MTPNPWERLREAAEAVVGGYIREHYKKVAGHFEFTVLARDARKLVEALAALPATPPQQPVPDEERERAIGNIRDRLYRALENGETTGEVWISTAHRNLIDDVVALLRSAPAPQPTNEAVLDLSNLPKRVHKFSFGPLPAPQPVPAPPAKKVVHMEGTELGHLCGVKSTDNTLCSDDWSAVTCSKCCAKKPAPPASDWRERWNKWVKAGSLWDTIEAMHDGLAALEAEVARLRAEVLG